MASIETDQDKPRSFTCGGEEPRRCESICVRHVRGNNASPELWCGDQGVYIYIYMCIYIYIRGVCKTEIRTSHAGSLPASAYLQATVLK